MLLSLQLMVLVNLMLVRGRFSAFVITRHFDRVVVLPVRSIASSPLGVRNGSNLAHHSPHVEPKANKLLNQGSTFATQ